MKKAAFTAESNSLYEKGLYGRAQSAAKKALDVGEKAIAVDDPRLVLSLNNLAELYRAQGQYVEAEPLYKRALAIMDKAFGPDHPYTAEIVENMAQLYRRTDRGGEAEELEVRVACIRAIKR